MSIRTFPNSSWRLALVGLVAPAALAACQSTTVTEAALRTPTVISTTAPPTATRARTPTSIVEPTEPTATRRVPTATLTPILTRVSIPVSTFDAAHAVMRTPAPAAICPAPQRDPPGLAETVAVLYPDDPGESSAVAAREAAQPAQLLALLDAGGAVALLQAVPEPVRLYGWFALGDVTGDGVDEVIAVYRAGWTGGALHVYGCDGGHYREVLTVPSLEGETAPTVNTIADLNANGVPDLVIDQDSCHWCYAMQVIEWDGQAFQSLARQWLLYPDLNALEFLDYAELMGLGQGRVADLDGNGTLELILEGGTPSYSAGLRGEEGPWREQTITYAWNGQYFVWNSQRFAPAVFRYEALQDADDAVLRGDDEEALALYQDVIFSDQLRSWTPETWRQMLAESFSYPDVTRMPFNPTEHAALSGYARYRILVLHLHRGLIADAETVYRKLLDQVAPDNAGAPYQDLARAFWEAYQTGGSINDGCTAAVAYATRHPELLDPLGNSDGRMWGRHYQPEEICPFTEEREP